MNHQLDIAEAVKTMSTVRDFIRWAVTHFTQNDLVYGHGTDNAWDEAVNLVLTVLHLPPDIDNRVLGARLTGAEKQIIADLVKERIDKRIPVAYLVKEAWFGGYRFYVDQRVIIPRSPIAELIEDEFSPWVEEGTITSILDLCTGSGCIAVACALMLGDVEVDAVDISPDALAVAKINVDRYGVESQVNLIESDLFTAIGDKQYDIIVSNPPYVSSQEYKKLPDEYHQEPKQALVCEDDGLSIVKRILVEADRYLTPRGILIVEVGLAQERLEALFEGVPFTWLQFERGGEGVLLLTVDELKEFKTIFAASSGS